jgi:hypothetical protein
MPFEVSIFVELSDLQTFTVSAILLLMTDLFIKENRRNVHNLQSASLNLGQPSLNAPSMLFGDHTTCSNGEHFPK